VNGVRLRYVERGSGEPLVLLHGNGSMIQDFESSGLIDLAAKNYRVFVFDRPGFGHSDRPRNVVWTHDAQAALIKRALERLGVSHAVALGHSWGASVATALALKYPGLAHVPAKWIRFADKDMRQHENLRRFRSYWITE
jgi:pimeloyl-ACP methyl ester carboxylesterase